MKTKHTYEGPPIKDVDFAELLLQINTALKKVVKTCQKRPPKSITLNLRASANDLTKIVFVVEADFS